MYKYVKEGDEVRNINIPEKSQIDRMVVRRIRQKYSADDENKFNNLREQASGWEEFNEYLEECRQWDRDMKAAATTDKELWKDFQWNEMEETRQEFIERLEIEGLI
jgi:broad specificity polyphosphatase/5'/3'-nucleotidase SurE